VALVDGNRHQIDRIQLGGELGGGDRPCSVC